jgi:hypothetical protein
VAQVETGSIRSELMETNQSKAAERVREALSDDLFDDPLQVSVSLLFD